MLIFDRVAREKWVLLYSMKQGKLTDVVHRLSSSNISFVPHPLKQLPHSFLLKLFSLMAGEDLPPNTKLEQTYKKQDHRALVRGTANFSFTWLWNLVHIRMWLWNQPTKLTDWPTNWRCWSAITASRLICYFTLLLEGCRVGSVVIIISSSVDIPL